MDLCVSVCVCVSSSLNLFGLVSKHRDHVWLRLKNQTNTFCTYGASGARCLFTCGFWVQQLLMYPSGTSSVSPTNNNHEDLRRSFLDMSLDVLRVILGTCCCLEIRHVACLTVKFAFRPIPKREMSSQRADMFLLSVGFNEICHVLMPL